MLPKAERECFALMMVLGSGEGPFGQTGRQ